MSDERDALIASLSREDPRWWYLNPDLESDEQIKLANMRLMRTVRALDQQQQDDKLRMARCERLYDPNSTLVGITYELRTGPYPLETRGPITMNIAKSAVDTVTAMIAKTQPRAAFMTDGADWSTMMKARDLERAVEGEFQRLNLYALTPNWFRDAAITGQGILRPYWDEQANRPEIERVCWDQIVIDKNEWMTGRGRQIHELRFIDKDLLMSMYPDKADEIAEYAKRDVVRYWTSYRTVEDNMVPLIESWHLPDVPPVDEDGNPVENHGGIHTINMDGVCLLWEEYVEDEFPHEMLYWAERTKGFWGCGLIEEVAGLQNRINKINWHIAKCHDLSNTYVVVEAADAKIRVKQSGGNVPLQVLPFNGTRPPSFETPMAVQKELYDHLLYLVQMVYKLAGVSELSAASQKPEGVESAIALQTLSDMESQRFSMQQQRLERGIIGLARKIIKLYKRAAENDDIKDKIPEASWKTHNVIKRINWKKVNMPEDLYVISIEAASMMSRTPAGRIQAAVELGNAGLFERDELRRLIGHPDLERAYDLDNAYDEHAERIIEDLLHGKYRAPDMTDGVERVLPKVAAAFVRALDGKAPEDILDGFRSWLIKGQKLLTDAAQSGADQQAASQPPPQGQPGGQPPPQPPQINMPSPQVAA